ncbi:MAG TPA: hypothetical protein VGK78_16100 [Nocardioides sp.]|uniref:hypothetical protein n=1 Tax=Nocardioides sp. TaxID=35761 RepID=UPI002F418BBC
MHSLHVTVALQGDLDPIARQAHLDQVVSEVASKPGLVHAYFLAPHDGVGSAYAFFDTEEHAREGAPEIGFVHSGVALIKDVEVLPVMASI